MTPELPHDLAAERRVLGYVIRDGRIPECARDLVPSDFYAPANAALWRAIRAIEARAGAIDALSVEAEVRRAGDGPLIDAAGGDDV